MNPFLFHVRMLIGLILCKQLQSRWVPECSKPIMSKIYSSTFTIILHSSVSYSLFSLSSMMVSEPWGGGSVYRLPTCGYTEVYFKCSFSMKLYFTLILCFENFILGYYIYIISTTLYTL